MQKCDVRLSSRMIYSHCVLGQVDRDCPEWVFLLLAKTEKKKNIVREGSPDID